MNMNAKPSVISSNLWLFFLIFVGAVLARIWNLGGFGLFTDELYHVIGAQSILEVGRPIFPSGDEYTRALGFTYLTAFSFKLLGVSEFAARLPSVILNLAFILVSFEIIRRSFNARVALIYLIIMSFSPFMLTMARQCRMYAGFQFFYVLAAFAFYRGFEYECTRAGGALREIERRYGIKLSYLCVAFAFLAIAYHLQPLAINFGIVVLAYALVMAVFLWREQGLRAVFASKYFIVLALPAIVLPIVVLLRGDLLARLIQLASDVPIWDRHRQASWQYYRYFFEDNYPFLFFLYPLSAAYLIKKKEKFGIFIVLSFALLFILHSVLYKWRLDRYVFYIFPFLSIPVAVFLEGIFAHLASSIKMQFNSRRASEKIYLVMASLFALNLFFYPWLNNAKSLVRNAPWSDWKQFYNSTGSYLDRNIPIIATSQNSIFHYFGEKPEYYLRTTFFEAPGDAEYFAGSAPIIDLEQLKEAWLANDSLYLISENNLLANPAYLTENMREFILNNFEEVSLDYKTSIRLFKKVTGRSADVIYSRSGQ
jgi:4-amino-4-deoxy-L-arabinose transferase-like glycosyltransferase